MFAILQKYDFSSKSQQQLHILATLTCCLRYCKSTIFQANHNSRHALINFARVVCDTAKVRFFKQITTDLLLIVFLISCLRYCKSTIFQANHNACLMMMPKRAVVCDTAKVRFFKQITTVITHIPRATRLFAILQKYDFSSKSQPDTTTNDTLASCLRYCKSTIFQANHNKREKEKIATQLFAILQKYDFSSKSQPSSVRTRKRRSCLRYCKSTIFQANHNRVYPIPPTILVVCDTAKVRFFKQITTKWRIHCANHKLFAILQKYDFSSKSQQ